MLLVEQMKQKIKQNIHKYSSIYLSLTSRHLIDLRELVLLHLLRMYLILHQLVSKCVCQLCSVFSPHSRFSRRSSPLIKMKRSPPPAAARCCLFDGHPRTPLCMTLDLQHTAVNKQLISCHTVCVCVNRAPPLRVVLMELLMKRQLAPR